MHIDCEYRGQSSPRGQLKCPSCASVFRFLQNADATWEAEDYGMWLYSEHFQIAAKCAQYGHAALSASEQLNYLVGYLYYQVHNGGIWQYLSNPCGTEAPLLVSALKAIHAPLHAAAIAECRSYFPPGGPPPCQNTRDEIIDRIPESVADHLHQNLSKLVCPGDSPENLLVLLRTAVSKIMPSACTAKTR